MNRRILLGVTGSIAAYKAVELVRLFIKNGDVLPCPFVLYITILKQIDIADNRG